MHLLVLSAFRRRPAQDPLGVWAGLNAPFGAQCFPTGILRDERRLRLRVSMHLLVLSAFRLAGGGQRPFAVGLNAPFGAQCFPTPRTSSVRPFPPTVSMHLLVLSAFRREDTGCVGLRV